MKTTLNADGQIGIPDPIRQSDHLHAGDAFDLQRLTAGHYLLTRQTPAGARFTVITGDDGLPTIRAANGTMTTQQVKELESQTP